MMVDNPFDYYPGLKSIPNPTVNCRAMDHLNHVRPGFSMVSVGYITIIFLHS